MSVAGKVNWFSVVMQVIQLTVGALVSAVGVTVFMAPFQIAPGGVLGISVIINHLNPALPIGLMVLIGNIPIQILGFRMLGGWRIVASTVYYVVVSSLAIDLLQPVIAAANVDVGHDVLLNALFGGIIGGIAGGLVYRAGGTLGGTSTIARILQNRYGVPLSTSALYTDTGVIALAGLVFGWEGALYAMVALFLGGVAADYVLEGPSVIRTATIITDQPELVSHVILQELGRGVTFWDGKGMFTEKEHGVLFVTIARPQVNRLRALVFTADPSAFVVIGHGHIAYGQGFRRTKQS
ncbi:MAG: YitT family protein [Anaerolineaceae bacterium]|nr:YitT family protein [Anaerolineaceae bacterium]